MPRTVVYDTSLEQAHLADVVAEAGSGARPTRTQRGTARERAAANSDPAATKATVAKMPPRDTYLSKIAKYVPAESVTFTLAAFAAWQPDGNTIWVFVGAGALANVVYLLGVAMSLPATQRPRAYFYFLSVLAFFGWAIAVVEVVQAKAGIEGAKADEQTAFVLLATAFLVPALDSILSKVDVSLSS